MWSQLVLWWTGVRFTPAIWCYDMKTAFYVRALLGKGLRICPHCSESFLRNAPIRTIARLHIGKPIASLVGA